MPQDPNLRHAEGYFELGLYEEALEELALADRRPENRLEVMARSLEVHIASEDWGAALPLSEALCELDPEAPAFCIHHAFVLRELGRVAEARDTLLEGPEELRNHTTYHYNLGCYEALLGNTGGALASVKEAIQRERKFLQIAHEDTDLEAIRDLLPPLA
mgnify:CR=1 FL=1